MAVRTSSTVSSVFPRRTVPGGRLTLYGEHLFSDDMPVVLLGDTQAHVTFASAGRVVVRVPATLAGGVVPVRLEGDTNDPQSVEIGEEFATGLHQVDNPVFDAAGNVFVTYSGSRGQETPVSIFKVTADGSRAPFASGVVNATSMAVGLDQHLYVSSRFEGAVYRIGLDGVPHQIASDLGVACGLAFDADGWLYVGDRSGTIFRVREGRATAFATLPPSIAAFHLAMSPSGELFVTAPTLAPYDHIYRIDRYGGVSTLPFRMGRPQGLTFGPDGHLYVVDALASACGLYRIDVERATAELWVTAAALVGVAFAPSGELVVSSNETAWRFGLAH